MTESAEQTVWPIDEAQAIEGRLIALETVVAHILVRFGKSLPDGGLVIIQALRDVETTLKAAIAQTTGRERGDYRVAMMAGQSIADNVQARLFEQAPPDRMNQA